MTKRAFAASSSDASLTRRAFLRWGLATGMAGLMAGGFARWVGGREVSEPQVLVGDVLGFALKSDDWSGDFGFVTFRLQLGFYNGKFAYFIRTDCSDRGFAKENGLVFVPRLRHALTVRGEKGEKAVGDIYLFAEGIVTSSGYQPLPVLSSVPGQSDYSPLFRVHYITSAQIPELLVSKRAIEASVRVGEAKVETTDIVVNYPVVRWPMMTSPPGSSRLQFEGYTELPHDTELEEYLGGGQLIGPVDLLKQTVTFKLQKCFPNFRYIVTDTSMAMGAQMMHIAYSPGTALIHQQASRAMARVFVFGNGISGGGPMGFQSSLMDPPVGRVAWSPLWDHFTVLWQEPSRAVLIEELGELNGRLAAGELQLFNGTPMTHPQGFVVNCAVPVES